MRNLLQQVWTDATGATALLFAFTLPVLLLATAVAVDSASLYNQQGRMQAVADATALAVAKELHLLTNNNSAKAAGKSRAEALLAEAGLADTQHEVTIRIDKVTGRVNVAITLVGESLLPAGTIGESPISVVADAQSYGQARLCILGLDRTRGETVMGGNGAVITAPDCAIQSNSSDQNALVMKDLSTIVSIFTCTSGGYSGSLLSYLPPPQTDCPPLADPLAGRVPPSEAGLPTFRNWKASSGQKYLEPGIYEGGITISNKASVIAKKGIYIIKGGKLTVNNEAKLVGENVGFYFADDAALLSFENDSVIELSAPKDGAMAGILFFENPAAQPGRQFVVDTSGARKLLGTIYLPQGIFRVNGANNIVGALSAYTVIVADQIDVRAATLIINADYGSTDVPVPDGLGSKSNQVRLVN